MQSVEYEVCNDQEHMPPVEIHYELFTFVVHLSAGSRPSSVSDASSNATTIPASVSLNVLGPDPVGGR
jgi:hypothetical protein